MRLRHPEAVSALGPVLRGTEDVRPIFFALLASASTECTCRHPGFSGDFSPVLFLNGQLTADHCLEPQKNVSHGRIVVVVTPAQIGGNVWQRLAIQLLSHVEIGNRIATRGEKQPRIPLTRQQGVECSYRLRNRLNGGEEMGLHDA